MIVQLRGMLVHKAPTQAIIDVGGVGYGVAISLNTYEQLPPLNAEVLLFTYPYVREDRLELFGFADPRERQMFELLIGVSGIGPSSARTVLSGMSVSDLQEAIFHERVRELTAIKGIGRKTAERLIIELRDKIQLPGLQEGTDAQIEETGISRSSEEARLALIALGIAATAARQAVDQVVRKYGPELSVQQLIKRALQER